MKNKFKMVFFKDSVKVNFSCFIILIIGNNFDKLEDKGKLKVSSFSQLLSFESGLFFFKFGIIVLLFGVVIFFFKSINGVFGIVVELEEEKVKKLFYCLLCKVVVNFLLQLEVYNIGFKYKIMVEVCNGVGLIKFYFRFGLRLKMQNGSKGLGLQNKIFYCEICDVYVNLEI